MADVCDGRRLRRVNHDFQFSETWQPYRFVFTAPADGDRDFVRLGQWEQKRGPFAFDGVEFYCR